MHFTAGDLARTRIADGPDPLWEIILSVQQLAERRPDPVLRPWLAEQCPRGRASLRTVSPLMPPRGYFPDFLTPAASLDSGLENGIEAVLCTPRRRLRTELAEMATRTTLPAWTSRLADGEPDAMRLLGRALRQHHAAVLEPAWRQISERVQRDRQRRIQAQCAAGTEAMLRTFDGAVRWESPVLIVDYPVDRDLRLDGRGLVLVPSYFCRGAPVALADPGLPPVLVYPATAPARSTTTGTELAQLLGHTRAAVLATLSDECTTSELARRAGVSASSASEHATVLRQAGLVTSTPYRNRVHHTLTTLGAALLAGNPPR
ncbi:ArsR/SmtB family transcription factor [Actinophytocola sediminis]